MFNKIIELLKVKSIVTLALVFTFCSLLLFGREVQPVLKEVLMLVLGFYFAKGTIKTE